MAALSMAERAERQRRAADGDPADSATSAVARCAALGSRLGSLRSVAARIVMPRLSRSAEALRSGVGYVFGRESRGVEVAGGGAGESGPALAAVAAPPAVWPASRPNAGLQAFVARHQDPGDAPSRLAGVASVSAALG